MDEEHPDFRGARQVSFPSYYVASPPPEHDNEFEAVVANTIKTSSNNDAFPWYNNQNDNWNGYQQPSGNKVVAVTPPPSVPTTTSSSSTMTTTTTTEEIISEDDDGDGGEQTTCSIAKENLRQRLQHTHFSSCHEKEEIDLRRMYQDIVKYSTCSCAKSSPSYSYSSNKKSSSTACCCCCRRLLLISGPDGSGKSHLAKTLRRVLEDKDNKKNNNDTQEGKPSGYFVSAKYDFLRCPAPYTASVAAVTEFTHQVVARGPAVVAATRRAILDAVGDEAPILTSMIPCLERIFSSSNKEENGNEEVTTLSSTTTRKANYSIQRFASVYRKFVKAICSREQPLIVLLDDLHFADQCSVDILTSLVMDKTNEGLVLIGTVEDSQLEPDSYLSRKLREIEDKAGTTIKHIVLTHLSEAAVEDLLVEVLELEEITRQTQSLTQIICQLTDGNLFFIRKFLLWLLDSDLLWFDKSYGEWKWDDQDIQIAIGSRKPADFLIGIHPQLPRDVQDVLKVAACLGPHLNETLLEYVLGVPVGNSLQEAADRGLLVMEESRGCYAFAHNRVQQAAYNLIPEDERESFHLEVGLCMWRKVTSEELDFFIFSLLSQLKIGRKLIQRECERAAVAKLCLHAGTKAAKSSTFRTALTYLELGIDMLDENCWQTNYHLALLLHNAAAEMAMATTNVERRDELLEIIFHRANSFRDKLQAYGIRIHALGVGGRQREAIDVGINVMAQLGEKFPSRICKAQLFKELKRVKMMLRGKSDAQLLRMRDISNEDKLACLRILHAIYIHTLTARPRFIHFIMLKGIQLTLEYGLSAFASVAFANYGVLCVSAFKDIDLAFRYGKLAISLLERYKTEEYLPRVYFAFYGCIYPWKMPISGALESLKIGYRTGLQTGDIEGGCLCANFYVHFAFESGMKLESVLKGWQFIHERMTTNQLRSLLSFVLPAYQTVHNLMGLSKNPVSGKGDIVDYDTAVEMASQNGHESLIVIIHSLKLLNAFMFNDYQQAAEELIYAKQVAVLNLTVKNMSVMFFAGLVAIATARQGIDTKKNLKMGKSFLKELNDWRLESPHIVLDKIFLLEAELASLQGRNSRARAKYMCAIALAQHTGLGLMIGLANERFARHHFALGNYEEARSFFDVACNSYREWGGMGKHDLLRSEINDLFSSVPAKPAISSEPCAIFPNCILRS